MSKEVVIDTAKLNRMMDKVKGLPDKLFREKTMSIIATKEKNRIFLRTVGGTGTDGNKFKPYNANYALAAGKLSVNDVNLTSGGKGSMLSQMTVSATDSTARIFFNTDEKSDLARKHEEGKGVPKRAFFGISDQDGDDIYDEYLDVTEKLLKKDGFE